MKNPNQIYSTIKTYIDDAANFREYTLSGRYLNASQIRNRELFLAIPDKTTPEQWKQIQRVVEYGGSKNVTVRITRIK